MFVQVEKQTAMLVLAQLPVNRGITKLLVKNYVKSLCESVCWNCERFFVPKSSPTSYNHKPNKSCKTSIFGSFKIHGNCHELCCCSYFRVLPVKKKFLHCQKNLCEIWNRFMNNFFHSKKIRFILFISLVKNQN